MSKDRICTGRNKQYFKRCAAKAADDIVEILVIGTTKDSFGDKAIFRFRFGASDSALMLTLCALQMLVLLLLLLFLNLSRYIPEVGKKIMKKIGSLEQH